jgi:hypothetical protein
MPRESDRVQKVNQPTVAESRIKPWLVTTGAMKVELGNSGGIARIRTRGLLLDGRAS